ncbi:HD domain-containing protein [Streptomyces sp. NPDC048558]|uniref:HD domain-containing protein n=1 Tax=Streptomyces sp. NPDC048558 TaxID=3155759 RepID=UPI0033FC7CD5
MPIERAHDEAALRHAGQTPRSGDPLLTHCLAVAAIAAIVADIGMPPSVICAALLHDIVDAHCPPGRVSERVGPEVADLIRAVRSAELTEIPRRVSPSTARGLLTSRRVRKLCWRSGSPTGCTTCAPSPSWPRPSSTAR